MISFLKGVLQYKKPPFVVVDVQGVGYECQVPMSTFYQLPELGQALTLQIHFAVREDAHVLYGFLKEQERTLFRALIKVSNVGPKLALALLSGMEPNHFVRCIEEQDISTLTHIPGVGKKTAERLIIEMRDRLQDWGESTLQMGSPSVRSPEDNLQHDALSALISLGFKPQEGSRLISQVKDEYHTAEDLIRLALQSTQKGGKQNDNNGSTDQRRNAE